MNENEIKTIAQKHKNRLWLLMFPFFLGIFFILDFYNSVPDGYVVMVAFSVFVLHGAIHFAENLAIDLLVKKEGNSDK